VVTPDVAPVPRPKPSAPAPPRLRVVASPAPARTRVPFVLACMGVLALALFAALLLNTQAASQSFARYTLTNQLAHLQQDQMDLQAQLDAASSPTNLAAAATKLGMVPANGTGWIRLADGTVSPAAATPAAAGQTSAGQAGAGQAPAQSGAGQ